MRFKNHTLLISCVLSLLFFGCNQNRDRDNATSEEIITARTLGLAYLEENKLEEARDEFLKVVDLDPKEVLGYANLGIVYLRMGEYREAEDWLQQAIKMDQEDPDVRLILAKVYEMSDQPEKSIVELEKIIKFSPGHVKSLYQLSELYRSSPDPASRELRRGYLDEMVGTIPGNIVPRLNLIEILIRDGECDLALRQMEELQQVFPEFPKESLEFHKKTIAALQQGKTDDAEVSFMVFHNYLKVTSPYQAGITDLKGPGGSLIGFPVISFDQKKTSGQIADWKTLLEAINFTDILSQADLEFLAAGQAGMTSIIAADYDGDGDTDLYVGKMDPESQSYRHYLLSNDWGKFADVTEEAGISQQGKGFCGSFADYDNDGFLDLFLTGEESNLLYRNSGNGTFEEVSEAAGISESTGAGKPLFFDYDHDGDLDLFIAGYGPNLLYRNNADGTFTGQGEASGLAGGDWNSTDASFGDFDNDGDIDLVVINEDASCTLYSNQRQGVFRDITEGSGLESEKGSTAITIGDYNNDGFLDLFVTSQVAGNCRLYRNLGDAHFEVDESSEEITQSLAGVRANDAVFLDFDNDGYLDLLVTGQPEAVNGEAVILYHNDGSGTMWLAPGILPENIGSANSILVFDYNEDGDLDVALVGVNGGIRLLRNDGGNNNHYVKMKLVGLRTGSGKNNYYGIGARIEIRSGGLYQVKVVTEADIHFGLGPREKAEVIRILWTNGVPQNIFFPQTDQDLVEEQILKGSCPFLYTWNGSSYVFTKDIMWRSALGMPLGIMGETSAYAPPGASVDYIMIPGEALKPVDNSYSLQITCELWETIYMDKVELVAVDHPANVEVYVDEGFSSPDQDLRLYQVGEKKMPISAWDHNGQDILPELAEIDDKYVSGFQRGKYQGLTEMRDMVLELGELDHSMEIHLYLHGWIFPTDASINASTSQSSKLKMISPYIQVINEKGEWETIIDDISFPMGKAKTQVIDLSGKIPTSDPRIRICTNMEIYWDQIFFTNDNPDVPVQLCKLEPSSADLHFRGFSRSYRKGGRYGPHWFDYSQFTVDQKWRDLTGNYTRYGDVLPLLTDADDKYIIKNAGDETSISFSAEDLPPLPEGWKRDFLIHSVGWVKDGDLNTATGQTVDPLPFHGMTSYPYGPDESYPSDPEHQEYLREYNTRKVTTEELVNALIKSD